MEFAYDGGGLGKGGTTTLFVDGDQVGSTRVERTHALNYSLSRPAGSAPTPVRQWLTTTRLATTPSPARSTGSASTSAPTATTT